MRAIYQDHIGLVNRSHNLRKSIKGDATTLQSTEDACSADKGQLEIKRATLVGANGVLLNQNRDQQTLIAGCQEDAIKRLAPVPFQETVILLSDTGSELNHSVEWLILSNKVITPITLAVTCNRPITGGDIAVLGGGGTMGSSVDMVGKNSLKITVDSPAWTPRSPLRVTVTYIGIADLQCAFFPRT